MKAAYNLSKDCVVQPWHVEKSQLARLVCEGIKVETLRFEEPVQRDKNTFIPKLGVSLLISVCGHGKFFVLLSPRQAILGPGHLPFCTELLQYMAVYGKCTLSSKFDGKALEQ